jgi:deoxyribonuclease V
MWPSTAAELVGVQAELARAAAAPWACEAVPVVCGVFVCFRRGDGDEGWAAAALTRGDRRVGEPVVVRGVAGAPYERGMLALREGVLLEAAVRALAAEFDVLLVNAGGRDHPRRAGLALHLGAVLGVPSVGVTDRPLLAEGPEPAGTRGATSPLVLEGVEVARWVRTRAGARPVVAHPGWRTDLDTAVAVVRAATRRARTPEPIRLARRAARSARAADGGR